MSEIQPAGPRPSYHQMRAFNAVMKEGNFSRAAKALGVTQPAITAQVRSLEDAFGVTLFERSGAVARPTRLAVRLFRETDQINDIEQVAADLLGASFTLQTGELSIVSGAPNLAMAAVAEYRRRHPGVRIVTAFGNWHDVTTTIYERRADVAILTSGPGGERLVQRRYAKQKIVALIQKSASAVRLEAISLAELTTRPLIFRTPESLTQMTLTKGFADAGLAVPEPAMIVESREAVLEAVKAGLGVGFAFSEASSLLEGLRQLPIRELPDDYWEDVFCLKTQYRRQVVRALFDVIDDISPLFDHR